MGKEIAFGGITIELCAMPRRMDRSPPKGEPYYPFKLGYRFKNWKEYASIDDVYRLLEWQLTFEKKVHFLNEHGEICDVKDNSHWERRHLAPLKEILKRAKSRKYSLNADILMQRNCERSFHSLVTGFMFWLKKVMWSEG